jgi:hypothetical protein
MKKLVLIFFLFACSSCCTKSDCSGGFPPELVVKYTNFNPPPTERIMLLILDRQQNTVVDSMQVSPVSKLSDWNLRGNGKTTRDYDFVFKTYKPTYDTIRNFSYKEEKITISCNQCFLAEDKEEITVYKDFSYYYKGQKLSADTLLIPY